MARRNWTRTETLAAFALYCRLPFGRLHARNPQIITLSERIGRSRFINSETGGSVRVARDLRGFALATLTILQGLAAGVSVNGISVDSRTLPFDAMVIPLTLTAEED